MDSLAPIIVVFGMVFAVGALVAGILGFAFNGKFYQRNANRLMRVRVIGQGVAILGLGIIIWLAAH